MIYVDQIQEYPAECLADKPENLGIYWAHLWCDDGQLDDLHAFARKIGLKREWFQDRHDFPHYDVVAAKRRLAVLNGATPMQLKEWLKRRIERRLQKCG